MSYQTLGQTQTRTLQDYERLCAAGDAYACRLAQSLRAQQTAPVAPPPTDTPEQIEARRVERERQAQAEREAIASRVESVGLSAKLVQAIKQAKDVVYAPTIAEGERIIRQEQQNIWWSRNKNYVYAGLAATVGVAALILFSS